ncbi:MAG: sigma-54-dependent Fis family transcriptional regulator, partial [bacterium]|nr:sigma-54-dependent Fis family transcriptional regulator [bacterium]
MEKILIIEDEEMLRKSLKKLIELKRKCTADEAPDIKTAEEKIQNNEYDFYLMDMRLPDGFGLDLLKKHQARLGGKTIVMTAHATIADAVEAVNNGAFYYLEKPLASNLLFSQMDKISEIRHLKEKNTTIKNELISKHASDTLIYKSKIMEDLVEMTRKFALTDNTILINGHTGVGKEIFAKFIHTHSKRKDKIYLPINCSSIPEHLFESELFGFKKGSFTGADENYKGRFIQADNGTIFLDEIGDMPLPMQAKLLRVLEDEMVYQLGYNKATKIDIRLIAATNRDLWHDVETGRFRKDLYFRLIATRIQIPALSERKEDIMPLAWHYITLYNSIFDKNISCITKEAKIFLKNYNWEGNVRELKNTVKSIFSLIEGDTITMKDLTLSLHNLGNERNRVFKTHFLSLEEFQRKYIEEVLKANDFNIKKTAQILKISRN